MGLLNFIDGVFTQFGEDMRAKINRDFQAAQAEKNRDFQRDMYDRQLDDSIAWRTHQEQYNSPEAQMSRYRDAGINPMFAVTGNGQNTVMSPMSMTSGFGSSPSGGSNTPPIDSVSRRSMENTRKVQENQMQNNTVVSNAQAQALLAEANEHNARAEGINYENSGKRIESLINQALEKAELSHPYDGNFESGSYVQWKADIIAQATEFEYMFNQMNFRDAKNRFEHLPFVRQFERDLQSHQRSLFQYELSQARSAAEVFSVSAKWAIPNQWINATTQVLGAAGSMLNAFKGTSLMPFNSRSYSESYGDHTTRNFNKRVGNEIQSPESMMKVMDINY